MRISKTKDKSKNIDYLYVDFPTFNVIDDQSKSDNSKRVFTGGVRINSSHYRTKEEDKLYRTNSLNRPLP